MGKHKEDFETFVTHYAEEYSKENYRGKYMGTDCLIEAFIAGYNVFTEDLKGFKKYIAKKEKKKNKKLLKAKLETNGSIQS